MKKSMLLSFVTAGAIIATSVGTYAAWDQTTISSGVKSLSVEAPVVVELGADLSFVTDTLTNTTKTTSSDVTFKTSNTTDKNIKLTLVSDADGTPLVVPAGAKVNLKKGGVELSLTDGVATDTNVTDGDNKYTVTVSLDDSATVTEKQTLATNGINIGVKAELVDSQS